MEAWRKLPKQYSGSDLRSAVLRALAAADGAPHGAQLTQLHRGRMTWFFGLIPTASKLGIIRPEPLKPVPPRLAKAMAKPAGALQQTYRLGTNLTVYEVLDPSASKCDKFLDATRAEENCLATPSDAGASTPDALDDLVDYGTRRAREALQRIGTKSGAVPFYVEDASGYCIDFLTRKLVAARLLQQNLLQCDWSFVNKASLQSMSADAKNNLEKIPDWYNAREISSFLTGRADWGLFASVFPCLWGEVTEKLSTEDDRARALALVKSKDFLLTVQSFRPTKGIAPHPAVAYGILEKKQSKCGNLKVSPRASTPRKKQSKLANLKKTPRASTPQKKRKASTGLAQKKQKK